MDASYENTSIIIITHDVTIVDEIIAKLSPLPVKIFDGKDMKSWSKLVNTAMESVDTDNNIFINYKARPTIADIDRTLNLLNQGYGFVGLYRFGFFGFNKNLIKHVGFFDERYIGGDYIDNDFLLRLVEHNIAYYISEDIEYHHKPTLWNNTTVRDFYTRKWGFNYNNNIVYKHIDEESYNYNLRIRKNIDKDIFLDKIHTHASGAWGGNYSQFTIIHNI